MSDCKEDPSHAAAESSAAAGHATAGASHPGAMNAYDIPRYNAAGYVLGRPQAPNDPMSAGMLHGSPAPARDAYAGFMPPPPGTGYAGYADAYTIHGPGPIPGYPPPQAGGAPGVAPGYGPFVNGAAAQGYGPAASGYPGYPPPQGSAGGTVPGYGSAQPSEPASQPRDPSADKAQGNAHGRIAEVVKDIANGQTPDAEKMAALFDGFDGQFWKGALAGVLVTLLFTNETVRSGISGAFGTILGGFKKQGDQQPDDSATT